MFSSPPPPTLFFTLWSCFVETKNTSSKKMYVCVRERERDGGKERKRGRERKGGKERDREISREREGDK